MQHQRQQQTNPATDGSAGTFPARLREKEKSDV
jgi:hypothetical protein